ncbi:hypothetical protein K474DRAFT_1602723 [Panus rudis PR-1116 ss-1]|nr:hypothetical protein K474DRAFT_1602723 [Panus rudis PR-1116 ss-1]
MPAWSKETLESLLPQLDDIRSRDADVIENWSQRLNDGSSVVSVRDVKKSTPNGITDIVTNHGYERHVLPVSESEIKEQKNVHQLGKQASSQENNHVNGTNGILNDSLDALSEDQRSFLEKFTAEMKTMESFMNNLGEPKGDLKLLDGDAHEQLESLLSVDDQDTLDSWIPRSPRLLRLTGKHPFNAEPNLTELFEAGMITPTKLHFVRNHAAVPQLAWETHKLAVFATPLELLAQPREWMMDELASGTFKIIEIPVTMGCDGNRRKEVNMVKKTSAFHWTSSGVSTSIWRGVLVREILLACGLQDQPDIERWHLNFEGADELPEGKYATSIPLVHAMNPMNDVMLAFGMNGRVLHPDHGYPLRAIIPGHVGGRQVKWLNKMWISKEPNRSYYHIWDNKIIPSFIDSKDHPLASALFHHESTAANEHCLQCIIVKPSHNERIQLNENGHAEGNYTVEGFAFNGGGDRVERVELSLDGGKTWKYCFRRFVDSPLRHCQKYWAWIFWSCEVKLQDLISADEITVRAHDGRKNFQPEHITWYVLNHWTFCIPNAWYRVRPKITQDPRGSLQFVQFQHPVAPGNEVGGWMEPPEAQVNAGTEAVSSSIKSISLDEVAKHNTKDDAWIILDNKVYDVTSVLDWHPGGETSILTYAGKASIDATNEVRCLYGHDANSRRDESLVGALNKDGIRVMEKEAIRARKELAKIKAERKGLSLQPDLFTPAKLVKRKEVSGDTRLYTFELPRKEDGSHGILGLPVGKHIQVSVHFRDQAVVRSYTPVRPVLPDEEDGTFELLVKTYMPSDTGPFPPGGTMSNYLDCMEIGEEIDIRGPSGGINYKGDGVFNIAGRIRRFHSINLVAGGSGLTPHWQLIRAILSDPTDKTAISLIDRHTFDDILFYQELHEYAKEEASRFKIWHLLDQPPQDLELECTIGRLNHAIMAEHFYQAAEGVATFLCGPQGLLERSALPGLKELGFKDGETIFRF